MAPSEVTSTKRRGGGGEKKGKIIGQGSAFIRVEGGGPRVSLVNFKYMSKNLQRKEKNCPIGQSWKPTTISKIKGLPWQGSGWIFI